MARKKMSVARALLTAERFTSKTELKRFAGRAFYALKRADRLSDVFKMPAYRLRRSWGRVSDEAVLAEVAKYGTRDATWRADPGLYQQVRRRGLLNRAWPDRAGQHRFTWAAISDAEIAVLAAGYKRPWDCERGNWGLYEQVYMRGMLNKIWRLA